MVLYFFHFFACGVEVRNTYLYLAVNSHSTLLSTIVRTTAIHWYSR